MGWIPQLKARKTSTLLFKDRYVGVREAPPRGRPAAGPARYAVADVPRSAHQIVAERFRLRALEPVVTSSNFFMLSELLAGTSLTAVVPGHLARLWASRRDGLRIEELPFQLPGMSIRMHWSAGNWRDEGIDWLRGQSRGQRARLRRVAGAATRDAPPRGDRENMKRIHLIFGLAGVLFAACAHAQPAARELARDDGSRIRYYLEPRDPRAGRTGCCWSSRALTATA